MSAPVSPKFQDTLDVDHLIIEIEGRPALWDKYSKPHSDRILKTRLWEEVCQKVIPNWDELTNEKKRKKGADIQKRWKNLKDCFARELASQKTSVSGQSGKKKRKYIYFDQLSFLLPVNTPRETSGNVKSEIQLEENTLQTLEENTQQTQDSRQSIQKRKTSAKAEKDKTDMDDEELVKIIKQEKKFDEDVSFAEMIVPMLRKLNDDQKLYARMEILHALDRAKRYVPGMQGIPHASRNIVTTMYPNTSATRFSTEPGTTHANRNIVILNNKTITTAPRVQEACNDYIERFANDLQSPEPEVSQNFESATRFSTEPGTTHANRNIVILNNKTITTAPRVQEACNDYIERFANDLQSPEPEVSQNFESATRFSTEPGTTHANRNIVDLNDKTNTTAPRVQEACNDYIERFANDLQSPEPGVSQNFEDYYDVTYYNK